MWLGEWDWESGTGREELGECGLGEWDWESGVARLGLGEWVWESVAVSVWL